MTFLVAYDDTPLSRGALRKAIEYAGATGDEVVAVAVVPRNDVPYLREKRWVNQEGGQTARMRSATAEAASRVLRGRVERIAPSARFEPVVTDGPVSTQGVAAELRRAVADHEADDVFVGARDADRVVDALISPGDPKFHLHLIRRPYIPAAGLAQYS